MKPHSSFMLCVVPVVTALAPIPAFAQDMAAGERLFRQRCTSCHSLEEGQNRTGPHLSGVIGRTAGSIEGARYSNGMKELGIVWDAERISAFIANPRQVVRGTTMSVSVRNETDRADIVEFLASQSSGAVVE